MRYYVSNGEYYDRLSLAQSVQESINTASIFQFMETEVLPFTFAKLDRIEFKHHSYKYDDDITIVMTEGFYTFDNNEMLMKVSKHCIIRE